MSIAMLEELPELEDAWVEGFEMKVWNGIYPTLILATALVIEYSARCGWSRAWTSQCLRLQLYET